jgi:beta-xylosidase
MVKSLLVRRWQGSAVRCALTVALAAAAFASPARAGVVRLSHAEALGAPGATAAGEVRSATTGTTYTNPVGGTFPDPMAALTGADYYAYGTGTNFPILHSTDLVSWQDLGETAFTDKTFPKWSTGNPWAPSVLMEPVTSSRPCPNFDSLPTNAPCFYFYYTGRSSFPGGPNCVGVATSERPDGGFIDYGVLSNGVTTNRGDVGCGDAKGYSNIDPAPFVSADGQAYLLYQTGRNAAGQIAATISAIRLAPDLVEATGSRVALITGTQRWELRGSDKIVEGPWLELHRSTQPPHASNYYLFYSGGDFAGNYAMGYAVGPSPLGPFTKSTANPILKGTSAVVGPGGGSVITGPRTGADQMIYAARSAASQPRTLRLDRLVWNDTVTPATVYVHGPTTGPQPLP